MYPKRMEKMTKKNTLFKLVLVKDKSISAVSIVAIPIKTSLQNKDVLNKRITVFSIFRRSNDKVTENEVIEAFESDNNKSKSIGLFESNGAIIGKNELKSLIISKMNIVLDTINNIKYKSVLKSNGDERMIIKDRDIYGYTPCLLQSFGRTHNVS